MERTKLLSCGTVVAFSGHSAATLRELDAVGCFANLSVNRYRRFLLRRVALQKG
jgi:hypothetical protein